jgi:hypothetical protein
MIDYICGYCDDKFNDLTLYLSHIKKHDKQIKKKEELQDIDQLILTAQKNSGTIQLYNQYVTMTNPMGNIQFDDLIEELDYIKKNSKYIKSINTKIRRKIINTNTVNNDIVIDINIDDSCDKETLSFIVQNIYSKINNHNMPPMPGLNDDPSSNYIPIDQLTKIFGSYFSSSFTVGDGDDERPNYPRYYNISSDDDDDCDISVSSCEELSTDEDPDYPELYAALKSGKEPDENGMLGGLKVKTIAEIKSENKENDKKLFIRKSLKNSEVKKKLDDIDDDDDNDNDDENDDENDENDENDDNKDIYSIFLSENTIHCMDNNIHNKDLYSRFEIWHKKKYEDYNIPSKIVFMKNMRNYHIVHDSIKSNGKFSGGIKNLKLI